MSNADSFRRRAEDLLNMAAQTSNMAERSRLIDEVVHWHNLAMDAAGHPDPRSHDNDDGYDEAETG